MRIALFSDIHGNYTGLCAVLQAIDTLGGADMVIAAGDLVLGESGGDDLIDMLRMREVQLIRGDSDTEEKLIRLEAQAIQDPGSTRNPLAYYQGMRSWLHQYVSDANRAFLADLPFAKTVDVAPDQRLFICHASPRDISDRICAPGTHPDIVREVYAGVDASVIAFGHWHASYVRWLDHRMYLNVASVGFRHDGLSWVSILTYQAGQWVVEQHAVPYDVAAEAARVLARGVPQPSL